ncbi:hypothetical protein GUITHDRAFT_113677 [Guillardia theta CCMP2712]|uniref:Mitochondrial carrier protein n=2 Tax=Guillardia theta TaxID=55529 RepID=L1IVR0_GUITC|nr:hypothetical protein GUITHDRAFT_113677 [Guillardia theta CCMP2712]EKX40197.1 hypothetical protein GUITHDRAFT_113677 [Guillardia theta CCMP2712]|mmetsp:Transcript_526/g.1250  ORF Transcript_526/g.1250 Transcript_526/m.1250 type:complete len:353 (+) Transcript_526:177-1235(+)|eukprot:XP_005827177.1 hypothetical protein GUITHDRAFT_113677 [Guillardia theta CCMP2712]
MSTSAASSSSVSGLSHSQPVEPVIPGSAKAQRYRPDLLQDPEKAKDSTVVDVTKRLVAGGIAGAWAKTAIAPLDRTKIIFQTSEKKFCARNVVIEMVEIVKREGVNGLWRGNCATVMRVFPYAGIQFAAFDVYKHFLSKDPDSMSAAQRLLAGSAAGATAVAVTYPLDLIRARLAVRRTWEGSVARKVWWQAITGGHDRITVKQLYRGLSPTLLGILPYAGIAFLTRDTLNHLASKHYHTTPLETPLKAKMFAGAVAGLVAQSSTYPLDLVRRRMQTEGFVETGLDHVRSSSGRVATPYFKSISFTLHYIYKQDGLKGLFKGLSMNWIKGPVAFMISFTVFDYMKIYFRIER